MCAAISETTRPLTGLVSIHDVMPETRERVATMLQRLALPAASVTLLVVPGRNWQPDDLAWLLQLQQQGHPLAGHGWYHQCGAPSTLYHKLHSLLLSRNVAEHLSLSGDAIVQLIQDCHRWFGEHELTVSDLYVPPAWALGRLTRQQQTQLPFRYVETLSGILDTDSGETLRLPLVGFEADTAWRSWILTLFNGFSLQRARASQLALRIGLHPRDFELRLAPAIEPMLGTLTQMQGYSQAMEAI